MAPAVVAAFAGIVCRGLGCTHGSAEIPEWFFPDREPASDEMESIVAATHEMRKIVVACFAEEAWPNAEKLRVGFDSETRVAEGGGWHYFN
ncbi:hypothetical protein [Planotetraspora phitsanulokensis]|uniref:hypothetical protein n=1 Tax=Planotetraspora phitsanulokensis TaxID=575192 RepID=UPI001951B67B|nr:hypothetical protein [Planotetraspora phitsanulokensis]